jgi:hypothetical protein
MVKAMTVLAHYSLLEGVAFREDEFLVLCCWCLVRCFKD